jgi:WG containing repeat
MKHFQKAISSFLLVSIVFLQGCGDTKTEPGIPANNYLLLALDSVQNTYSYYNLHGDIVIPPGKYSLCMTDTFKNYALVLKAQQFVVIDRQEKVAYEVFNFDNGPDYPSEGLFRILRAGKIGYADAATYEIVIQPQFDCAFPFENGVAKVSTDCKKRADGEHSSWVSDKWRYIDKKGKESSNSSGK